MQTDIVVADIAQVAADVRRLGTDRSIINDMARQIRREGRPTIVEAKARARSMLPAGGGLNDWVASTRFRVSVRRGAAAAGVAIIGGRNSSGGRSDIKAIDAGRTRHPSWGRRGPGQWHPQSLPEKFFAGAVEAHLDDYRAAIVRAVTTAMARVGL